MNKTEQETPFSEETIKFRPHIVYIWGRRVIGVSGSLICSKTLMELIFKPYDEFRRAQLAKPTLLASNVGPPGIFSDLLRSVQMLNRDCVRKATGSYCIYLSLVKLHPWSLRLQWKTCSWAEYSDDDDDDDEFWLSCLITLQRSRVGFPAMPWNFYGIGTTQPPEDNCLATKS